MSDVFKILGLLDGRNVPYCFNRQVGFYNLSVNDRKGKNHYVHGAELKEIERGLKILWGDLIETPAVKPSMGLNFNPMG